MSARAIVSGVLFKAPASKISKAGKPYVVATIREGSGERVRWWKVFMRLNDGEPIAVTGEFDAELYSPPDGAPRLSWKITADSVLSAHAKRKPKTERSPRVSGRDIADASWAGPQTEGGPNDDLPF
jgi:hypothetical protein